MNREDLIAALQEECLADRMRIEDFLHALADICLETLERGERFTIPEIGTIQPTGSAGRRMVTFFSAERLRDTLGVPAPLCIKCKKNDRAPGRKKCQNCREQSRTKAKASLSQDDRLSWIG